MSEGETLDILENKPADHVTGDEMEKKEDRVSLETDKLTDEIKDSQDEGSSAASELKAEPSEKCFSQELQIDSATSLDRVEIHDGQTTAPSMDKTKMHDNIPTISDKISAINLSSGKEGKEAVPTQAGVPNQPPPPPPENLLSSRPNKQRVESSDHKEDETKIAHKDTNSRITAGSFTDTYDVISRKEVQNLNEWENIHKECLLEIPPIDPGALQDIERKAKEVASNLDHLLHTLNNSLKSMSVIGVQSVDNYKTAVENTEVIVDASIKSMYTLIAKCEELNSYMGPLYSMSAQIKDIKTTLDIFESVCK